MHLTARVFLLRMIDVLVEVPLHRPIAAGRIGIQATAGLDCQVRCLLHRLHGEISGRVDDDSPLAADPRDDRWSVLVIMPPPGLTFLTTATRTAPQRLLATACLALGPSGRRCDRGHPLPPCLPTGDRFRRKRHYSGATSTSDSWSGYEPSTPGQCAATNTTGTTGRWPESSMRTIACSGGAGYG